MLTKRRLNWAKPLDLPRIAVPLRRAVAHGKGQLGEGFRMPARRSCRSYPRRALRAGLTIEYVDSVCGSAKTLTAIAIAVQRARDEGTRTIIAMPTLQLIDEISEVASRGGTAPVTVITAANKDNSKAKHPSTTDRLHASGKIQAPRRDHLLHT